MILMTAKWYLELPKDVSNTMNVFATWWMLCNPEALTPQIRSIFERRGMIENIDALRQGFRNFDREDKLVAGHFLLTSDRNEVDRRAGIG
jgi:hypothetical protein